MYEIRFSTPRARLLDATRFGKLMAKFHAFSTGVRVALDQRGANCKLKWSIEVVEHTAEVAELKVTVGIAVNVAGPPHVEIVMQHSKSLGIVENGVPPEDYLQTPMTEELAQHFFQKSR